MRKQQIPLGIVLFSMVILTGCGGNNQTPELSSEVLSTEAQHETEKIAVTLVNASNLYLREVIFTVPQDSMSGWSLMLLRRNLDNIPCP